MYNKSCPETHILWLLLPEDNRSFHPRYLKLLPYTLAGFDLTAHNLQPPQTKTATGLDNTAASMINTAPCVIFCQEFSDNFSPE
jgi:hypothetical protein